MLLRAFSSGAVALSGVEAISNGVPAFRKPEPRNAAHDADRRWARILGTTASSASRSSPPTSSPYRGENDPTGIALMAAVDLRRQGRPLLDHAGRHVRHPDPRRQHRLRRLPPAVVDHRPRRLPAPPARQPRRPAGVLQRDHLPGRRGRRPDHRLQGQHQRPDPALRLRRVHGFTLSQAGMVVHHYRLREPRLAVGRGRSTASAASPPASSPSSSWSRSSPRAPGSPPS